MPQHILLALGSDPISWRLGTRAIDRAVHLADHFDAALTLLHVDYVPAIGGADQDSERTRLRLLAGRRAVQEQLAAEIAAQHGLCAEITTVWGQDRCRAILRAASLHSADLIVLSTRASCRSGAPSRCPASRYPASRYPASRYPDDASSTALLYRATCPVWLIDPIAPSAAKPSISGILSTNLPAG